MRVSMSNDTSTNTLSGPYRLFKAVIEHIENLTMDLTSSWIPDSGASKSMYSHRNWFSQYSKFDVPHLIYLYIR